MFPKKCQVRSIQLFQHEQASGLGLGGIKFLDSRGHIIVQAGSDQLPMTEVQLQSNERIV